MIFRSSLHIVLLAGASLGAMPTIAVAQDVADSEAEAPAPAMGEIVVTAQRREERLQDVPVAISAFSAETLDVAGIQSTSELPKVTPGFNFARSGFGVQPTIRGLGTRGTGAGEESVVPIYIDGIYQPTLLAGVMQLPDIERVEILRGPQGTLYGRNATGGAISIVTKRPSVEPAAELMIGYGKFDEIHVSAYASAGSEKIQASFAIEHINDDGFVYDLVQDKMNGANNTTTARAKLAFQPAENFELTLSGAYARSSDNSILMSQPINGNTSARRLDPNGIFPSEPYTVAQSFAPFLKIDTRNVALTAKWETDAFDLTSISSYYYSRFLDASDSDASTPKAQGSVLIRQLSKSFYQEVYLTSAGGGNLDWIIGGVYYHDNSKADPSRSEQSNLTAGPNFGVVSYISNYGKVQNDALAAYAQATWRFLPSLSLQLGGRYTREKKDLTDRRQETLNTRTNVTTIVTGVDSSKTWEKFTPSATLTFQPNRDINLYAKYGRGFKSGQWNATSIDNPAVDPENVTQYELGAKLQPLPWLRTNFAGYITKARGLQTTARNPDTNLIYVLNAASAEIKGFEVELSANPLDGLSLFSSFSYQDAKYTSFPNAPVTFPLMTTNPTPAATCSPGSGTPVGGNRQAICDVSGNTLIRTPKTTFNFGGNYAIETESGTIDIGGNAYHAGKAYADVGNKLAYDPYWDLSAQAAWTPENGRYTLTIWGENLTNKLRYISMLTSGTADVQVPARPRTYGVRFTMRFGGAVR